jgi:hypothetical protein
MWVKLSAMFTNPQKNHHCFVGMEIPFPFMAGKNGIVLPT